MVHSTGVKIMLIEGLNRNVMLFEYRSLVKESK
jgi:hypothetical protein